MNKHQSTNTEKFLRLILLSYETSHTVTKVFTKFNILPTYNNSLAEFLERNKHEIYHLWINDVQCCQVNCNAVKLNRGKALNKEQFKKLYILADHVVPGHYIKHSKVVQYCMCGLKVNPACTLDKMDMTSMHSVIRNCCKLNQNEEMWWNAIRKIRNKLSHLESVSVFDQGRLEKWWTQLEDSILGLAGKIAPIPEYKDSVKSQINFLTIASFDVSHANTVLDLVKTENSKLKDTIVEEQRHTRNIFLKSQGEQTDVLMKKIEDVKEEVIRLIDHNHAELTIEIKHLVFKIILQGINKCLQQQQTTTNVNDSNDKEAQEMSNSAEQLCGCSCMESDTCFVEWKLQTPQSWKVEQIAHVLEGASKMLNQWFQVKFVYVGSLVIVTSAHDSIFHNLDFLCFNVKSFLQYIIDLCGLDTDESEIVHVTFSVLEEQNLWRNVKSKFQSRSLSDLKIEETPSLKGIESSLDVDKKDIERRKDSIQRITDNTSHNILVTEHNLTPKEVATAKERVPLDDLEPTESIFILIDQCSKIPMACLTYSTLVVIASSLQSGEYPCNYVGLAEKCGFTRRDIYRFELVYNGGTQLALALLCDWCVKQEPTIKTFLCHLVEMKGMHIIRRFESDIRKDISNPSKSRSSTFLTVSTGRTDSGCAGSTDDELGKV